MTCALRRILSSAALAGAAVLALAPSGGTLRAAAGPTIVRFNIEAPIDATVASDGRTDTPSFEYSDYRFDDSAGSCVDAQETSRAFAFIVLNRRISDAGPRCSPDPASDGLARQVRVIIDDPEACAELAAYDPRYVEWSYDDLGSPVAPCRLLGADNMRIRLPNLFAPKVPTTTPVDFLISSFAAPAGHGGFELRSNGGGHVSGNATVRTVTFQGTSSLYRYSQSVKIKPFVVGGPVAVKLSMTFEKALF